MPVSLFKGSLSHLPFAQAKAQQRVPFLKMAVLRFWQESSQHGDYEIAEKLRVLSDANV